ncbi:MAG TPA: ribosome maturation factor RimM [Solirubrobacteraceae bacterium]|nr:ribosome maturation factor RimM [Solirubrobacteraceae bacterium]
MAPTPGQLKAGRVGRPHGLDGSFYVVDVARADLLAVGTPVSVGGRVAPVVRRAGTDERPLVRLEGFSTREDAVAVRGQSLLVDVEHAPVLGPDEFWAHELEGCTVSDGERPVGQARRLIALPSCEVLEVVRPDGSELLVPLVRDAIRAIDVPGRRIEVDMRFLTGEG